MSLIEDFAQADPDTQKTTIQDLKKAGLIEGEQA